MVSRQFVLDGKPLSELVSPLGTIKFHLGHGQKAICAVQVSSLVGWGWTEWNEDSSRSVMRNKNIIVKIK